MKVLLGKFAKANKDFFLLFLQSNGHAKKQILSKMLKNSSLCLGHVIERSTFHKDRT